MNPAERFTNWVDDYVAARPSYPPELLDALVADYALTPAPDHPNYLPMLAALDILFDTTQIDGCVTIAYDTTMNVGRLSP